MIEIIKLSRYIYINPLTVALFAVTYFNRRLGIFCAAYSAMILHEAAHLAAAVMIGLKPAYICFQPFGVNLKLKNRIVYSLADEIILYFSGPLVNIVLALAAAAGKGEAARFFYMQNIALFTINMLPVYPLDGGVILKKIISYGTGPRTAQRIMYVTSAFVTAGISLYMLYSLYRSRFDYSTLFLTVFLIANIFTQKEKYNADAVKEVMFYRKKEYKNKKVKFRICGADEDMHGFIPELRGDSFYIIITLDKAGGIDEILTETEVLERLLL
ncbi:MAG: hypothetical protein J1F64_07880 [Oscillospiraceae bacterium]|nr:hypothetical protein [Oscillospiraceae bacterium]